MTTARPRTIAAIGLATLVAAGIGLPAPATANDVIAVDSASTSSAKALGMARVPTALASKPRTIVVTNHGGRSVTLFAKGERIRRILAPGGKPAVFTGLTPGRVYTVAVGGEPIGSVIALTRPAAATGLTVRTTSTPGTVQLTWQHSATAASGGSRVTYDVLATSPSSRITATVIGKRTATLTGLDPQQAYTFTVTPKNSAGRGVVSTAQMSRTLGEATSTSPAPASTPATATPGGAAPGSSGSGPAASTSTPKAPTTVTIRVCPDGFSESGELCSRTMAYTTHMETELLPYTYTAKLRTDTMVVATTPNGSWYTWTCPIGYTKDETKAGICTREIQVQVTDPPPLGYSDNGTGYERQVVKKDTLPSGWLDDGTQWVQTTSKIDKVVPV